MGWAEEHRVARSQRFRAVQRRRTWQGARAAALVVIGVSAFDIVTSAGRGQITVVADLGLIGLASAGWWSLAHWARHYPEWVAGIVATGIVVAMTVTVAAEPGLMLRSAGYFLILPLVLALLLPWSARAQLGWLVMYCAVSVAVGYFALARDYALTPDIQGDLITLLIITSSVSLIGRTLLDKARIRSFIQMQDLRALRRQSDARAAQLAQAHSTLRTLRASELWFERRALHDPLTGLANRDLLGDRLAHGLTQRGATVAFFMLDLDDFKAVNDRLGHVSGDAVLIGAAERFASALRAGDTLARLGGDEFAVVAPRVRDAAMARAIAGRLLASLSAPVWLESAQGGFEAITLRASAGIALTEAGACNAIELMRRADVALYRAKARGKNGWDLFEASMETQVR